MGYIGAWGGFEFDAAFDAEQATWPEDVRDEMLSHLIWLREFGPKASRPRVDTLNGSKHANMKELRFSSGGGEWRIAFAFDPRRRAILLVGGDKSGGRETRFYRNLIRVADERFDAHLTQLKKEIGMPKNRTLDTVLAELPEGRRARVERRGTELIAEEYTLRRLREARRLTQQELAEATGKAQANIVRLEKQSDLLISTLRSYIEGMGGTLELRVQFPDTGPVVLAHLAEGDEGPPARKKQSRSRAKS